MCAQLAYEDVSCGWTDKVLQPSIPAQQHSTYVHNQTKRCVLQVKGEVVQQKVELKQVAKAQGLSEQRGKQ